MKLALAVLKVVTAAFAILYLGDYLALRFQFPNHRQTLGTVQIDVYYAVRLKGSKTEFTRADPETATCTYSLLPQIGYLPCWYVSQHKQKWIEVGQLERILNSQHDHVILDFREGVFGLHNRLSFAI